MMTFALPGLSDLAGCGVLAVLFGAVFTVAELLWHRAHVAAEVSRKLVHAGGGLVVLLVPHLLRSVWTAIALAAAFALLLMTAKRTGHLPSVHGIARPSVGAALFPCAVALVAVASRGAPVLFEVPVLALALGDAAAALVGTRFGRHAYAVFGRTRSVEGSAAFAVVTTAGAGVVFALAGTPWPAALVAALLIATVLTAVEAASVAGWDNITIPAVGLVVTQLALVLVTDPQPARAIALGSTLVCATAGGALLWMLAERRIPLEAVR